MRAVAKNPLTWIVAAITIAAIIVTSQTRAAAVTCTGTAVNPTSNLENVIDNPGTYCLNGGVYQEADKQIVINADNVTVKNVPGERAEIRGRIRTNDGAGTSAWRARTFPRMLRA